MLMPAQMLHSSGVSKSQNSNQHTDEYPVSVGYSLQNLNETKHKQNILWDDE